MDNTDAAGPVGDDDALRGEVVVARATLRAPISGRECVYWAVRDRWSDDPREQACVDFWLRDAQGAVLVLGEHVRVDARAERSRRVVEAVEADLEALGVHLAALKQQLRVVQGPEAAKLQRERGELARLATLLHATKAHARGRVHVGKSRQEQEKWLEANAHVAKVDGFGSRTAKLTREVWEVVIEPGHEIMIKGRCAVELLPPEHGGGGGYREVSSGRVVRGTASAPVSVTGVGVISPARSDRSGGASKADDPTAKRTGGGARERSRPRRFAAVALFVALATALGLVAAASGR